LGGCCAQTTFAVTAATITAVIIFISALPWFYLRSGP
jgi:hypothetical protein